MTSAPTATAFVTHDSPRSIFIHKLLEKIRPDAKIEFELTDEFIANFPLKRRPSFLTAKGEALTETIAIAYYLVGETDYFGKTHLEKSQVLRWISYTNTDFFNTLTKVYHLLNDMSSEAAIKAIENVGKDLKYIDNSLNGKKYLAAEEETAADLFLSLIIGATYSFAGSHLGEMSVYPNIDKWFKNLAQSAN